ncbi:MAG: SpoIIE family protein phosphatase [Patescibacteria group bacterium]|nr:SpoIIE family protein phosphatase [Patescibacteria group bacterium]
MFKSLRTKILTLIITLIIVLISGISALLVRAKYSELRDDIASGAHGFAQMATRPLMDNFKLYFSSGFLRFNDAVRETLALSADISRIQIAEYTGNIIYDSNTDSAKKFLGHDRKVQSVLLSEIQEIEPSYYLDESNFANWETIPNKQITQIIFPYLDATKRHEYTVLYTVTYKNLYTRLSNTAIQIILLALTSVIIGILVAGFFARSLTRPLMYLKNKADEIAKGDLDVKIVTRGQDEISTLGNTLSHMTFKLKESQKVLIEKEKQDHEIELAREIQQKLLPEKIPVMQNVDISAMVRSADDVGGDIYDVILGHSGKLLFYVGDVTSHGVPAGLVSGMTSSLAFGFEQYLEKPSEILTAMNKTLFPKTKTGMYVTMVIGLWDDANRKLTYTCAGNEPAIYYNAESNSVIDLSIDGSPIGMFAKIPKVLKDNALDLMSGDALVLYTDGVSEAWNRDKKQFGRARIKDVVLREATKAQNAIGIQNALLNAVDEFRDGYEQKDDITILVMVGK